MEERHLKLNKKDIAYLQFILEGYEGLVTATTIDKKAAIVKLFIVPDAVQEVDAILLALKREIDIAEIDPGENK